MASSDFQVRPVATGETDFVYSSWLNSYEDSPFARGIRKSIYFDRQRRLINSISARGGKLLVATHPEAPDAVLGWVCVEEPDFVHYVFVKQAWRRMGVASLLLEQASARFKYTHRTAVGESFVLKRFPGAGVYDPYAAFRGQ
jgi:GNAT superfamily N-acetyltransferase